MAADPTKTQSTLLSQFRSDCKIVLSALTTIDSDRLKAASLGGFDGFSDEAYAGANNDIVASDIDAAMTALVTLRALLIDGSGNPTPALLAIVKIAR